MAMGVAKVGGYHDNERSPENKISSEIRLYIKLQKGKEKTPKQNTVII